MILLHVATWIALLCVFQGEICIAVQQQKHKKLKCRTRFTTARPTRENMVSILFGTTQGDDNDVGQANISFNHDGVGITQPVSKGSSNPFPTCLGYPDNTKRHEKFHKQLARGIEEDDEISTICSSTNHKGWRVLRFHKRVGYGKQCYKRVQDAVLDWDFDAQEGKKSMGIKSTSTKLNKSILLKLEERNILSSKGTSFSKPRRSLLASFTEICLPKPFQAIFVVSPVHVSYEVKDAHTNLKDLFSSTAYCTLSGHLLSGEERVTVIWRKGAGDEVDVEIVSFSRSAPSMLGKIVWPLIGRMQKQFFLSEMAHLDEVGKRKA